jgi:cell division protein FtsW (lipid II flippase)
LNKFSTSPSQQQARLIWIAACFTILYTAILTLSPAVLLRSWNASLRWEAWIGCAVWLVLFAAAHRASIRYAPNADPYLLPACLLISAWGTLTIWRLDGYFGMRQTVWSVVAVILLILGLRLPGNLLFLRRYKYVWLTGGLLLTALTLIMGTNPTGFGPRMWLGCCGIYLQPSEPLKILLVIYLAAYLAGMSDVLTQPVSAAETSSPASDRLLPWLAPTLVMTGLALVLLLVQRDLGTASIFVFLFTTILFIATGRKSILIYGGLILIISGLLGFWLIDLVRLRIDAWLNPWLDPSGGSYQIIQSLLAIASGGIFGRGAGVGFPGLVPIAHSDFVFAALAEEAGLVGVIGLVTILALVTERGMRIAMRAPDAFRRYLAAGLTIYLISQSVLIIGGNTRLLPLTGVTLPFISYGGSSLVTAYLSLMLLMQISNGIGMNRPDTHYNPQPYRIISAVLLCGLAAAAIVTGWWAFQRGPDLLTRTDNPRRGISDRYVKRGSILDRDNQPITISTGEPGAYQRQIEYPALSPIIGYTDPAYGQAGLEASMDDYLRGLRGNPGLTIWWHHILYGQPPPGLDIRTTLDLKLQNIVDQAVGEHSGAAVLLNAASGEVLAMASHPDFDANRLNETWDELVQEESSPLLNRAILGSYPTGDLYTSLFTEGAPAYALEKAPLSQLPVEGMPDPNTPPLMLSPLQVALSAAALSSAGTRPSPVLVGAVNTPREGWVLLPNPGVPIQVLPGEAASQRAAELAHADNRYWEYLTASSLDPDISPVSWYVGGTLPASSNVPLALAVVVENEPGEQAQVIGREILSAATP